MKIENSKIGNYRLTVGLEIHVELKTRTKMFCDSKNDPDEKNPNVNVCPVCMGYPGTLPVINKEAVKAILRFGVAVGGTLADYAEFDRKNYFYPDIPKGYQISQYKHPLVHGGILAGVKITRIHLEEDTAKSLHNFQFPISNSQSISNENSKLKIENSLLDFNRAGVPLMELVTEPVIRDAETATSFAKELQLLLNYLGIAEANMEKGEMRIEANVSVSKGIFDTLGTKVEVKNINSFKVVGKAIDFEYKRQTELLEKGEKVVQETRGWNDDKGETFSQRAKEESHDYRYFPDPDLPKLFISEIPEFSEEALKAGLPELPEEKRERLRKLGLPEDHIEIYVSDEEKGREFKFFQELSDNPKFVISGSNYIINEIKRPIQPSSILGVVEMVDRGELSSKGAKEIFKSIPETEIDVRRFAAENNLTQISDREVLKKFAEEALAENKKAPIQFLVGQVIQKSGGRANPEVARELLEEHKAQEPEHK